METKLAAVTGATGMVGRRIVHSLLERGHRVRVLTRRSSYHHSRVEVVCGDIVNTHSVETLLTGADYLFHCAAELNDESQMWATNVMGTQTLLSVATTGNLEYLCHLSSVGVIGRFQGVVADETSVCTPMNTYEKTKLEAERLVMNLQSTVRTVVLRPTNVVDKFRNAIPRLGTLMTFVKGGEKAHVVHAEDVAAAALLFLSNPTPQSPECFIVSCDEEELNTVAGCQAICRAIKRNLPLSEVTPSLHLPWQVPYLLRRITKGPCNRGDICFSSKKLRAAGFAFPLGLEGAMRDVCEHS